MSKISAGTTSSTALVLTPDMTGTTVLQTNGTTTALTLGATQTPTFAGPVVTGAGTTSVASLNLASTNINPATTPSAIGGFVNSSVATNFVATADTTFGYGTIPALQVYRLASDRTLTTSNLAQSLFGVGCTLEPAIYYFEMLVRLTRDGASAFGGSNFSLSNSGTNTNITFTGPLQYLWVGDSNIATAQGANLGASYTSASIGSTAMTTAGTTGSAVTWSVCWFMRGQLSSASTGTFNINMAYGSALGGVAFVVKAGSYMTLRKVGVTSGLWN